MAEYIDREAVKWALADSDAVPKYKADNRPVTDKIIDDIPAADVVPVVRCKDCIFYDHLDCYMNELTRPDDFCSRGERKDSDAL